MERISQSEIEEVKARVKGYKKESVESRVIKSCRVAFRMGKTQTSKKRLKRAELFERVDWVRGFHKQVIWEAYKSGLWEQEHGMTDGRQTQKNAHIMPEVSRLDGK